MGTASASFVNIAAAAFHFAMKRILLNLHIPRKLLCNGRLLQVSARQEAAAPDRCDPASLMEQFPMALPTDSDEFIKVFDALDSGFREFTFPVIGLAIVGLIITSLFLPRVHEEVSQQPPLWGQFSITPRLPDRWFTYIFLGFTVFCTTFAFTHAVPTYVRHTALLQNNTCRLVEGPVERFVPLNPAPHTCSQESFYVQGVHFGYSDSTVTGAFNSTSNNGGPINKDSYVRICYDPEGNAILRLEIRKRISRSISTQPPGVGTAVVPETTPGAATLDLADSAWEKVSRLDHLMRTQLNYDLAQARAAADSIEVDAFRPAS